MPDRRTVGHRAYFVRNPLKTMTTKRATLRKGHSANHKTVAKSSNTRAARKAATAKKTALAATVAATAKKAAAKTPAKAKPAAKKAAPAKK